MAKHEGMPNDKMTNDRGVAWSFVLGDFFVIRHSDFVIKVASVSIQAASFGALTLSRFGRIMWAYP
jgi:hypothetical protein